VLSPFFVTRLPGGIGNQLFSLFASRYFAQESGLINILDFGGIDYSHHTTKYDVSEFELRNHELTLAPENKKGLIFNAISRMHDLKFRLGSRSQALAKPLKVYSCELEPLNSARVKSMTSDIKKFNHLSVFSSVSGYFPDFSFFDELNNAEDKLLVIKNPSKQFSVLKQHLLSKRVLGVHIRLKDYLIHPTTIGNLSRDYFLSCIREALGRQYYDEIWFFSDSPHEALERFKGLEFAKEVRFVGMQDSLTPCEELFLLHECSGIVCSNSTFSFWAAKFLSERDSNSHIYIPSSFRKDGKARIHGLPSSWNSCSVEWIE
jgi:hypothetical protein